MGKSKFELKTPKGTKDCKASLQLPLPRHPTTFARDRTTTTTLANMDKKQPLTYHTPRSFFILSSAFES